MDSVRFGRQFRALRRRRRWRQEDVAVRASVSRGVVARTEQGYADRLTVAMLERLARPLGARLICRLEWNGEALDRLVDADHAGLVELTLRLLGDAGWLCAAEVSFNVAGERGSIDVLAWHPPTGALLVIEVKSVIPDLQSTLFTLDRKVRIGPRLAADLGWSVRSVSRLLVIAEDRTTRRRVTRHTAIFENTFPDRTRAVRRWIDRPAERPSGIAGLLFLSGGTHAVTRHRVSAKLAATERDNPPGR